MKISLNNLPDNNSIPTSFILFKRGINSTTKGDFIYDDLSEKLIKAEDASYGNDYSIDYNHQEVNEILTGPIPSAGWFKLDFREDGLYANVIRWTNKAIELIKNREYRYTSPVFNVNADNVIVSFYNVSLVNVPATNNLPALIAAHKKYKKLNGLQNKLFKGQKMEIAQELVDKIVASGVSEADVMSWLTQLVDAELSEPAELKKEEDVVKTSKLEHIRLLAAKDQVDALSAQLQEPLQEE
jgi:phage I-like protein